MQSTWTEGHRSQQNHRKSSLGLKFSELGELRAVFTSIPSGFGVFVWAAHPSAPQKCNFSPYSWNWETHGILEGFPSGINEGSRMRAGVWPCPCCIFPMKRRCCPEPTSLDPYDLGRLCSTSWVSCSPGELMLTRARFWSRVQEAGEASPWQSSQGNSL